MGGGMGGMGGMGGRSPPQSRELYPSGGDVVQLNRKTFPMATSSPHPWLVAFYTNESKDAARDKQAVEGAARNAKGLFKVGAVNCGDQGNQALCADRKASPIPKYAALVEDHLEFLDKPERPTAKSLHAFVTSRIPETTPVNRKASIAKLFSKKRSIAILLLTDKYETTPLWRSLAFSLRSLMTFAESRAASVEIGREFKVKKYPVIVALAADDRDGYRLLETYDGELSLSALSKWCRSVAATTKPSSRRRWFS
jgi:hypothetical protein